jgi:hypothetical protein
MVTTSTGAITSAGTCRSRLSSHDQRPTNRSNAIMCAHAAAAPADVPSRSRTPPRAGDTTTGSTSPNAGITRTA